MIVSKCKEKESHKTVKMPRVIAACTGGKADHTKAEYLFITPAPEAL